MRTPSLVLSVLACLALAGCMSSALEGVGEPSLETTSSIPRPGAPVAAAAASDEAAETAPAVQVAEKVNASTVGAPALEPIALVDPPKTVSVPMAAKGTMLVPPVGAVSRHRFRDAKPINFGKASPRQMEVHGVDVSRWQGNIDWVKLRSQGANFAYIKATDGGDHLDPMFRTNWNGAHKAGLRRGAYHFFYWCRTASEQADWFIRNVPRVAGALPPVIDVEWNGESSCKRRPSAAQVREKMQVFMDRLERHYGQRPVIYTAPDFYADNLRGAFPNHPFWLRAVAQHPSRVYRDRKWVFWQYSGSGLSHGVSGRIDLNAFHGSEGEWHNWLAGNVH